MQPHRIQVVATSVMGLSQKRAVSNWVLCERVSVLAEDLLCLQATGIDHVLCDPDCLMAAAEWCALQSCRSTQVDKY